ncbi:hypothetical protein A9Q99_16510 [Gammaproteobacteria bacterium 45_16_T64]|nr:hypothetical protein A9Q99_16510 [Gammaproteobacteria bacterium 45_16_T64]
MNTIDGVAIVEVIYDSSITRVYRGFKDVGQSVILKTTSQDVPSEFVINQYRESYLAQKKLNHPAINQVLALDVTGTRCSMVLEDIGGVSLKNWMASIESDFTRWPLEDPALYHDWILTLLKYAIQLAEGISELHQQNVIHNDINPANIIINPDTGCIQLIDFGSAFSEGSKLNDWAMIPQNHTLTFISPEQTGRLNRKIDYRSDYYAFGATLYRLFGGKAPFFAKDLPGLIHCHIARHPLPLNQLNPLLPESLSFLIDKLMTKAPEDRYQNGRCLIHDLKAIERSILDGIPFPRTALGSDDVPEKLLIPSKLFGRDEKLQFLRTELSKVHDKPSLIIVEGEAGGGKTALINEAIQHSSNYAVQILFGKGEVYNIKPHYALAQALENSVDLVLDLPEIEFLSWREGLLKELNNNPRTLLALCPSLEKLFDGLEFTNKGVIHNADIQLKHHTSIYLRSLSKLEPVILFIDDVQWCDEASIGLLEALIKANHPNVTIIFSCRTDEVDEAHVYGRFKARIGEDRVVSRILQLDNLSLSEVQELLSSTFHVDREGVIDIASLVHKKTLGNPLFVHEFIKASYHRREKALYYDADSGRWCWDIDELAQIATSGNVVNLLIEELHQQDETTQNILQWAACIGSKFSENLLSLLTGYSAESIKGFLNPLYQKGYICRVVESSEYYAFNHDRIRQAYYERQSDQELTLRHWRIGRIFQGLDRSNGISWDDPLPHLVYALNSDNELLDLEERDISILLDAFYDGALVAKEKTAYEIALQYICCALNLYERIDIDGGKVLISKSRSDLLLMQGAIAYLAKDGELAMVAFDQYRQVNTDPIMQAASYAQQTPLVFLLGDMVRAVTYSLNCLNLLGIDTPDIDQDIAPAISAQWKEFFKLGGFQKVGEIDSAITNQSVVLSTVQSTAASMILVGANRSQFQWAEWFGLVGLNSVLSDGFTQFTPQLLGIFDSLLCSMGKSDFSQSLVDITDEWVCSSSEYPGSGFVYSNIGAYTGRYGRPILDCVRFLEEGVRSSFDKGEYLAYTACLSNKLVTAYSAGVPLDDLKEQAEGLQSFLVSCGEFVTVGKYYYRLFSMLMDTNAKHELEPSSFTQIQWETLKNSVAYCGYFHLKVQYYFWSGEYSKVVNISEERSDILDRVQGFAIGDDNHFLYVIAILQLISVGDEVAMERTLEKVSRSIDKLEKVAEIYPPNHRHKVLLIQAEKYRILGHKNASTYYYQAAVDARDNGYIQMYALAHELHALYWQAKEREDYVRLHITKSIQGYQRWGCTIKLETLYSRFLHATNSVGALDAWPNESIPQLLDASVSNHRSRRNLSFLDNGGEQVGQLSLLKLANEISEEIDLVELEKKIVALAVEHTGADKGIFLFRNGSEYTTHSTSDNSLQWTMALVQQCAESKKASIVDSINNSEQPALKQFPKTSTLCYPIVYKGKCESLILLQHSSQDQHFSYQHIQFLKTLAPQFAVSLENAQLYREHQAFGIELEAKVEQRKQELQAANEELRAFTASVSHDLKAPLRAINGFTAALDEDYAEELGENSQLKMTQLMGASDVMGKVIDGLLTISRFTQSALKWEEINLSTLVDDQLRWLRTMEPNHSLQSNVQQGLTSSGDIRLIKQVVDNLIENAWKYSHSSAQPAISFGMTSTLRNPHTFYVEDNGEGFDVENAEGLFKPFRQFESVNKVDGAGVGLATVYRIIKRHGGDVWLESELGKGTTVFFTLYNFKANLD